MAVKYGMVLDMTKCLGCYACVVSCKMCYGTRPGINYNAVETVEWGEYPDARQNFRMTMCMHCEDAPCAAVCPTGATIKTEEGAVIVDYDACIGCGACVDACPYDQRHLVTDDETSYEGTVAPYEEESSERLNVAEKCTFCYGRVQAGEQPMCTVFCPGQCRIFGDVNDPESTVSRYIAEHNAVKIEGTSIYYVVPEGMDPSLLPPGFAEAMAAKAQADAQSETSEPAETTVSQTETVSADSSEAAEASTRNDGGSAGVVTGILGGAAAVAAGAVIYSKTKSSGKAEDRTENTDQKGGKQ